jgi:hypothetical protein
MSPSTHKNSCEARRDNRPLTPAACVRSDSGAVSCEAFAGALGVRQLYRNERQVTYQTGWSHERRILPGA